MKSTRVFFTLIAAFTVSTSFAEVAAQPNATPQQANCELRLISNAGAGQVFMAIFTQSEEECLGKSDREVEAKFHTQAGAIVHRGGKGPKP